MMPTELTAERLRTMPLPWLEGGSKDERGRVLVVAGSLEVPGAVLLAGNAALRAGAGKVRIATVRSAAMHVAIAFPESMVIGLAETADGGIESQAAAGRLRPQAEGADTILIGTGMAPGQETTALTVALCTDAPSSLSYVLDAAALHELRAHADAVRACAGRLVITPHAGEMAQLLGARREDIEADPIGAARNASDLLGAVVVMKGAQTHIVAPDGAVWLFKGGGIGLATAGSGDVLGGLVAGLLARGASPTCAALWGVFLHGEAGRRLAEREGTMGFLARDLAAEAPRLIDAIEDR